MEKNAFVQLYDQYRVYVYRYLIGLTGQHQTSEDLTQETFLRALSVLQSPREPIKTWLLTVAHNLYVDYLKKNGRLDYREQSYFDQFPTKDVGDEWVNKENQKDLFDMLLELPENQKQVLLLCMVNGLSQQEAASILGLSVSSVTNLIYRARKTLKARRKERENEF